MGYVIGFLVIVLAVLIVWFVIAYWQMILTVIACAAGAAVLIGLLWWWIDRKREEKERRLLAEEERREARRQREREERRRREEEAARAAEVESEERRIRRFSDAIEEVRHDCVVVDTNVFMNAAGSSSTSPEAYQNSTRFFAAIRKRNIKISILVSQLNEIARICREGDENRKYKARSAQREIENLQDKGLLALLGDATAKESYADTEIIREVQRLVKKGKMPLVITNDRDLKIRVNGTGAVCKSLADMC